MINLMVQKYEQTVLPTGEMFVEGNQEAASQCEDSQQQTESQMSSNGSDGTEV